MSNTQTYLVALLSLALLIFGCGALMAESLPVIPEERELQVEMDAYVGEFIAMLGMKYEDVQWSSLVQPVLFRPDTAMVYQWTMENHATLAVFTFDAKRMLRLTNAERRAVAAHEVGHVTQLCRRIVEPNTEGFTEFDAYIANFYYQILNEGCADVYGAEMTSYPEMVNVLKTLRSYFVGDEVNHVLNQRIRTLEDVINKETNHVE